MQQLSHPTGDGGQRAPVGSPPVSPIVWGIVLIVGGLLFLIQSLGFIPNAAAWLIAALFGVVGAIFLALLLLDRDANWWAAIPGMTMVGLGLLIYMGAYGGAWGATWAASLFLACIAAGFLLVLFMQNEKWWAIIPSGVLLSVAAMVGLTASNVVSGEEGVSILFFGMALTFLVVPFLPTAAGARRWWGLIPSAVLGGMGLIFFRGSFDLLARLSWIGPVVLIVVGAWIVWKAMAKREAA